MSARRTSDGGNFLSRARRNRRSVSARRFRARSSHDQAAESVPSGASSSTRARKKSQRAEAGSGPPRDPPCRLFLKTAFSHTETRQNSKVKEFSFENQRPKNERGRLPPGRISPRSRRETGRGSGAVFPAFACEDIARWS